ncbi:amidase family protein [Fusarium austroafricanum]|uniref:Amidase family protein n=1 Tax=Fusarium austroafricanum TaxID=2364996 RepID=A0A8H4KSG5_9HYPO|nr:amidase family protein [Fusarium austroafricanum]
MTATNSLSLVDATISDLKKALESGNLTSVELVTLYLHRIAKFDMRGPSLNSICILNPHAIDEAQASDDYRATPGNKPRSLEGIPFTVKDSFKVRGMTVAAGSPAFADLVAPDDAPIIAKLREEGAVILGRTNMPPMADGGPQRGLYGRAESPYSDVYGTTAYASGSSNGSGSSTTASFAAFGFGSETVTSGRSPASNNALVGYSPSRGVIPNRGVWPLYPTCDVLVPHTRTVEDLFHVLNVIVFDDEANNGADFWRSQPYIDIPKASDLRPVDYHILEDLGSLHGKRIAIPKRFLGETATEDTAFCSKSVLDLFNQARRDLECLGATLVEVDFPLVEQYTKKDFPGQGTNVPGMSVEWANQERCEMIAMAWDDFLRDMNDPKYPNFTYADPDKIHPLVAPLDDPTAHTEPQNQVRYADMISSVRTRTATLETLPGCREAVVALENMRKGLYDDWMDANGFDLLAFPTNGDVPFANADEDMASMLHALQDGIKYANGGRALKHLGVPCVTVPMGTMADKHMPVGITFATKAWKDNDLLRYAFAYENATNRRSLPPKTPELSSDRIPLVKKDLSGSQIELSVEKIASEHVEDDQSEITSVTVQGTITPFDPSLGLSLVAYVDGDNAQQIAVDAGKWSFKQQLARPKTHDKYPTTAPVPKDHFMLTFVAKTVGGRCTAKMLLVR